MRRCEDIFLGVMREGREEAKIFFGCGTGQRASSVRKGRYFLVWRGKGG